MTVKADVSLIKEIDHEKRVILFENQGLKRITGSRFASILGKNEYDSPFSLACEMTSMYSEYESTKYTEAGNELEPVMRSYLRANAKEFLSNDLRCSEKNTIGIEEPMPAVACRYEHFPDKGIFGGMVDGYVIVDGKRAAVLEIKTSSREDKWIDPVNGTRTNIPVNYCYQAALYAHLSGLKKIVFVAGFLRKNHYEDPLSWSPNKENCAVIVIDAPDISKELAYAERWYREHLESGVTPEWSDKDERIVEYLQTAIQEPPSPDLKKMMSEYAELGRELNRYADTADMISKIKKEMDDRKDVIKEQMMKNFKPGQNKYSEEELDLKFNVTRTISEELDKDRMKEDQIYDKYLKQKESFRMNIEKIKTETTAEQ